MRRVGASWRLRPCRGSSFLLFVLNTHTPTACGCKPPFACRAILAAVQFWHCSSFAAVGVVPVVVSAFVLSRFAAPPCSRFFALWCLLFSFLLFCSTSRFAAVDRLHLLWWWHLSFSLLTINDELFVSEEEIVSKRKTSLFCILCLDWYLVLGGPT